MDTRSRPDVPAFPDSEPPLGELVRALSRDAARLVRQEIALARAEVRQNVRAAARDTALIATGAAIAALGGVVLLAALVVAVGDGLGGRYALGALLVGAVLLAVGGGAALAGVRGARAARLAPDAALHTLRDTGAWARAEAARVRGRATQGKRRDRAVADSTVHPPAHSPPVAGGMEARKTTREERVRAARQAQPLAATAPLWKRVLHEFTADDAANQAARVAYYFFLSFPPALMALFGLTGLFGGPATADWLTRRLTGSLPREASALVTGFVRDVVHGSAPGPLSIGLLLALWAGSNVFGALGDALNAAFGIRARRSFIRGKAVAVAMLAACAVLFLSGSAVLVGGRGIAGALGLGGAGEAVWTVLQWPLGFGLITATFWLVYYVLPNRDQSGCRATLLRASAVAAALFVLASAAFRVYVANFGSYSATYGVLGTVIVLLLWMYVTSLVILLGGEVAAEMERGG